MNENEKYVNHWLKFYSKKVNMAIAMFSTLVVAFILYEKSIMAMPFLILVTLIFPSLYSLSCKNNELSKRIEELEMKLLSKSAEE